jgi:hypothetical protein
MLTGLLAARNVLAGENKYDVWSVNEDGEYHESGRPGERPGNASEHGEIRG